MRGKEEAHDYRYFPDPDLMPVTIEPGWIESWRTSLPELPREKRGRFIAEHGLPEADALVLTGEKDLADFFEAAVAGCVGIEAAGRKVSNWMMTEFLRELNQSGVALSCVKMTPAALAELVCLVEKGTISGKIGKQIFAELFATGAMPEAYVKAKGLVQISDASSLEAAVDEVLAASPDEVAAYRGGKTKRMGCLVGQIMKKTKGQANPGLVNELLRNRLD